MYAVVATGGKQYKVAEGDIVDVEKLDVEQGSEVELDILMLGDGDSVFVDADTLDKKKVVCTVVDQFKDDKVLVFKFHKRKRYRRTRGHRQNLTKLKVVSIPCVSESQPDHDAPGSAPGAFDSVLDASDDALDTSSSVLDTSSGALDVSSDVPETSGDVLDVSSDALEASSDVPETSSDAPDVSNSESGISDTE